MCVGLILGGVIPGVELREIQGTTVISYRDRILKAPLWIEGAGAQRIPHDQPGLLTHRTLDLTPAFGITTRESPGLDGAYVVFGKLLQDEEGFVEKCLDIPTYSLERPEPEEKTVASSLQASVYQQQREFFRGAAKAIGDTRVSNVFEGKFFRRIEVTRVQILESS
eukprot:CAMPEP_0116844428 /NCGR_PEP_ID=MMETSP0418-20121206/12680_1 /TAXON_ID=1158023 /ORGANISM="Astrosyne radiata, Strain 13vi08-1A" /LENGTH=165 /DNA_ID=CAMNT_0004475375 /DNA_START=556 /DNA_END=1053 /DNA_ORIENTATION=-